MGGGRGDEVGSAKMCGRVWEEAVYVCVCVCECGRLESRVCVCVCMCVCVCVCVYEYWREYNWGVKKIKMRSDCACALGGCQETCKCACVIGV